MTKVPGGDESDLVAGTSSSTIRKCASPFPLGSYCIINASGQPEVLRLGACRELGSWWDTRPDGLGGEEE